MERQIGREREIKRERHLESDRERDTRRIDSELKLKEKDENTEK